MSHNVIQNRPRVKAVGALEGNLATGTVRHLWLDDWVILTPPPRKIATNQSSWHDIYKILLWRLGRGNNEGSETETASLMSKIYSRKMGISILTQLWKPHFVQVISARTINLTSAFYLVKVKTIDLCRTMISDCPGRWTPVKPLLTHRRHFDLFL